MYGIATANMNNMIPILNLYLFSSNDPAINNKTPKNPSITGMICENKVIPVKAIFHHYYTYCIFSYINIFMVLS